MTGNYPGRRASAATGDLLFPPEFTIRGSPHIDISGAGEEERATITIISLNLSHMGSEARRFSACLLLKRTYSKPISISEHQNGNLALSYQDVGERFSAITLKNLSDLIVHTTKLASGCGSINGMQIAQALDAAKARLETDYPGFVRVRDSVAHAGELWANPKEINKNTMDGSKIPSSVSMSSVKVMGLHREDDMIGTSKKGQMDYEAYELSERSVINLIDIVHTCFGAFSDVDMRNEEWRRRKAEQVRAKRRPSPA